MRRYADRVNARDFDALRELLAQDVQLNLIYRLRLAGRKNVSVYFHRYEKRFDWRFTSMLAEGRPALLGADRAMLALHSSVLVKAAANRRLYTFTHYCYATSVVFRPAWPNGVKRECGASL